MKHEKLNDKTTIMDEGDIPKEVPREEDFAGEPENIIRGHKATISNPRMRHSSVSRLHPFSLVHKYLVSAWLTNGKRFRIATETSDRAKENSRKVLESYGEPYDASQASHGTTEQGDKDPGNVARGLKASISNPGVSEGAKKAAREKLDQLGA